MKKITQYIGDEGTMEIVAKSMERKGFSQSDLSAAMGEIPQKLNQQLRRQKDMKMKRFVQVMEFLGFEVMIVEREFRRVTPQVIRSIIEDGNPKGLFWAKSNGIYEAIDSTGSEVFHEEFSNAEEMKKWFDNQPCVTVSGYEMG